MPLVSIPAPNLPEIRSTLKNLAVIIIVTVACGIFSDSIHGEIHSLRDLPHALNDGLLYGLVTSLGWLGMRSPLAKYAQSLLQSDTTRTSTIISPDGEVKVEKTVVTEIKSEGVDPNSIRPLAAERKVDPPIEP